MDLSSIYNTLNYIESNYNKEINVKDLENISFYSYRNIQRIFKYSCNETIGSYQIRLRMENAYKLIIYTKDNISEIAYEVGFESLPAFSKAFKKHFGITPREARQRKESLIQKTTINPILTENSLIPKIVFLPEVNVFYRRTITNYVNEDIENLWERFSENDFSKNDIQYFGVIADEPLITEKIKCRYDACCTVQPTNKKFPTKQILGGKYAQFIHYGDYNCIEETYKNIYSGWILTCKLEFGNSPIIEQYIQHSSNTVSEKDFVTAILLPLKP